MRRGRSTMLLLGAILALLAFFVLYLSLSASAKPPLLEPTPVPPKVQVLVAQNNIPSYTVIKKEDVTIREMEASQVLSDTTAQAETVIGQVLVRNYAKDSQILRSDIAPPGISQVLTKGQRGFALPILEVNNFGGQLNDNDVVDVLWSRSFEVVQQLVGVDGKPTQYIKPLPTTKKILDNIKVLRVMHLVAGAKQGSGGPVNKEPMQTQGGDAAAQQQQQTAANQALYGKDAAPTAVLILAITDQQAEVIKFARENGTIDLTLRARDDTEVERTTGITDKIMSEDYGVVLPEILIK